MDGGVDGSRTVGVTDRTTRLMCTMYPKALEYLFWTAVYWAVEPLMLIAVEGLGPMVPD